MLGAAFRKYCYKHLGVDIKRGVSDLRVMNRQAVNALLQIREQSRNLRVLTLMLAYSHSFYPYQITTREGSPHLPRLGSEISTAINLLTSNTRHPLRLVTCAGMAGAFLNLLYALCVVAVYLTMRNVVSGWTTTSL